MGISEASLVLWWFVSVSRAFGLPKFGSVRTGIVFCHHAFLVHVCKSVVFEGYWSQRCSSGVSPARGRDIRAGICFGSEPPCSPLSSYHVLTCTVEVVLFDGGGSESVVRCDYSLLTRGFWK